MSVQASDFNENKTIFVSGIAPKVAEADLFKMIEEELGSGLVSNIRINRKQQYETAIAYINMNTHEGARDVINNLNGKIIGEKKINLSWSIKDYNQRKQNDSNLFVKGIKKDINQSQFQEVFLKYGDVMSVKLSTNEKNESNGFGYVKYVNIADTDKVLEAKEEIKQKIGDAENFVLCRFEKQPTTAQTNLYIGNIDANITEDQFVKYFETFGKIRESSEGKKLYDFVFVEKYKKNRGFVNFENAQDAKKALESPKKNVLGEGELVIAYYKTRVQRKKEFAQKTQEIKMNCQGQYKKFNLRVDSRQSQITESEAREKFEECGEIYSLKVKYYNHEPTGICYVCFKDEQSTMKAEEKCKALGWECNKMMTLAERMPMQMPHGMMGPGPFMYPMNYFNYMNLFPQFFYPFGGRAGGKPQGIISGGKPRKNQRQKQGEKQVKQKAAPVSKVEKKEEIVVTDEMKNELGDKLYDHILNMGYEEDLTGRITGVLLESIKYQELKEKIENKKEDLEKIVLEVKETIEKMEK